MRESASFFGAVCFKKSPLIRGRENWWSAEVTKGVVRSEITALCGCNLARKRWRENLQLYEAELWLSTLRVMCALRVRAANDRKSWESSLKLLQRSLLIRKSFIMVLVSTRIHKFVFSICKLYDGFVFFETLVQNTQTLIYRNLTLLDTYIILPNA